VALIDTNQQNIDVVSQDIDTIAHSLPDGFEFELLPDIVSTQGIDLESEVVSMDLSGGEYIEMSFADLNCGNIYAPVVPSFVILNPDHVIKLTIPPQPIKKYKDIYSNINDRFKLMEL